MEQQDIVRILRDVAASQGTRITIVRVQRLSDGWMVTITDQADRIVSTRLPESPAAAIRTALIHWLDTHA